MRIIMILLLLTFQLMAAAQSNPQKTKVCLIEKGELKTVEGSYDTQTGRHTVLINRVPTHIDSLHINNPDYAATAKWYINNEKLEVKGKTFSKYGLPRVLGAIEVQKWTTYKGVCVYIEAGFTGIPDVIYIPVRSQCEFQPYAVER